MTSAFLNEDHLVGGECAGLGIDETARANGCHLRRCDGRLDDE
jgi:hypothetical protein